MGRSNQVLAAAVLAGEGTPAAAAARTHIGMATTHRTPMPVTTETSKHPRVPYMGVMVDSGAVVVKTSVLALPARAPPV